MRNRILIALLVILVASSLSAATATKAKRPAFVADIVHREGMLPYLRLTASEDLTLIQEVEFEITCLDVNKEKIGQHTVHLVRRNPDVQKPWVSVVRLPEKIANRIVSVQLIPLHAKMAPPNGLSPTACLGFCQAAGYNCNEFCATDGGGTIEIFNCGNDGGGGCEAYCRCGNGAEAWW